VKLADISGTKKKEYLKDKIDALEANGIMMLSRQKYKEQNH
jgi:hypothetical protein